MIILPVCLSSLFCIWQVWLLVPTIPQCDDLNRVGSSKELLPRTQHGTRGRGETLKVSSCTKFYMVSSLRATMGPTWMSTIGRQESCCRRLTLAWRGWCPWRSGWAQHSSPRRLYKQSQLQVPTRPQGHCWFCWLCSFLKHVQDLQNWQGSLPLQFLHNFKNGKILNILWWCSNCSPYSKIFFF